MPVDQHIKDIAYKLDPEAWVSYSGKAKGFKQHMEQRRSTTLALASAAHELAQSGITPICECCGRPL